MTNNIFPISGTLGKGIDWSFTRGVRFNTLKKETAGLYRPRVRLAQYPVHEFTLVWNFIKDEPNSGDVPDLQNLIGFFEQRAGAFESFLLNPADVTKNISDSHATTQIGTGDGSTKSFQLTRSYGGATELVQAVANMVVSVGGVETTAYTVSNGGIVTFTSAPANGALVLADFDFLYRVTFDEDTLDVDGMLYQLYELRSLKLVEDKQ